MLKRKIGFGARVSQVLHSIYGGWESVMQIGSNSVLVRKVRQRLLIS